MPPKSLALYCFSWSVTLLSSLKFQVLNFQSTFDLNSLVLGGEKMDFCIHTRRTCIDKTQFPRVRRFLLLSFWPSYSPYIQFPCVHFSFLWLYCSPHCLYHHHLHPLLPLIIILPYEKTSRMSMDTHIHTFLVQIILNHIGKVIYSHSVHFYSVSSIRTRLQ